MSSSELPDLLLAYDFPPMGGGIARMMAEIAPRYPGGLVVSTGAHPAAAAVDPGLGCRVDRTSAPASRLRALSGQFAWRARVRRLAGEVGAGFIWCGNIRPAAPVGRAAARAARIGYGIILHGMDVLRLRRKAAGRWSARRRAVADLRDATWIVANSRRTALLAEELYTELGLPDPGDRLRVVPLGSDPARFHPGADPTTLRDELGLPRGRWLLTVARLVPHKGVDVAIEALAALSERYPDLRYAVAGDGPAGTQLRDAAKRLGVAERVHFLGLVPDESLPALYALATAYVGLSREEGDEIEGFGIAIADASAAGLPVVVGRSGGTDEVVRDGETGFRVDPRSPGGAADALASVLEDPVRAGAMGAAGRVFVERYLNWDRVAGDLAELSRLARATPALK